MIKVILVLAASAFFAFTIGVCYRVTKDADVNYWKYADSDRLNELTLKVIGSAILLSVGAIAYIGSIVNLFLV